LALPHDGQTISIILVSCPRNKHVFRPATAGSVGCFSRRSEPDWQQRRAYLNRYARSEQPRKTANWPRPRGCDENGPAAVLLVGCVSI
jgi:hypothetical protein